MCFPRLFKLKLIKIFVDIYPRGVEAKRRDLTLKVIVFEVVFVNVLQKYSGEHEMHHIFPCVIQYDKCLNHKQI